MSPNAGTRPSERSSLLFQIPQIVTYQAFSFRTHSMRTGCFARMPVFEHAMDCASHAQLEARAARLRQPGKQFKLGFFTQVRSRADQPARRTYDKLVESIVAAEDI